jgi:hypothetical protein
MTRYQKILSAVYAATVLAAFAVAALDLFVWRP